MAIGGFQAEGEAAKIVRGVPTVGRIANGALIEREIEFTLNRLGQLRMALRNPDFTTAKRIAAAINDYIGSPTAEPIDQSTVVLTVPAKSTATSSLPHRNRAAAGRAGSAGQDRHRRTLRHHRHGPRRARLNGRRCARQSDRDHFRNAQVSQPLPFARRGTTRVVPRTSIGVQEDGKKMFVVREGVSLQQVVDGLNALGIGPRDLIAILQAIKAAGAIQADIEVM